MASGYLEQGRTNQKRRTRRLIVDAAMELARDGNPRPSVADAAAAAGVSRATAYRYFPTQESLLVEVATMGARSSALDDMPRTLSRLTDPVERVEAVIQALTDFMVENDQGLRLMLKASLERQGDEDSDVPVRQGRRAGYLAEALAPLEPLLGADGAKRVNAAIGMVVGTEALVVLRDVYDMDFAEARSLMRWAASTLLEAAVEETRAAR